MSQLKIYPIACKLCDYEATAKSLKLRAMYKRLHGKKCKKTGRTKQVKVFEDAFKQFDVAHSNGDGLEAEDLMQQQALAMEGRLVNSSSK